jgi:predicted ATPase/DNA-binding SARP family transcriptional activator
MPRALVQFLASRPSRRATVDELVDGLWGHLPAEKARQNLRVVATHARAALGGRLPFASAGYELPGDAWVDLHDDPEVLLSPEELLTEQPYAEWAMAARERYRGELVRRLVARARAGAEAGAGLEALALCRRALDLEPGNEPVVRMAMQMAFDLGDRAGALSIYGQCRAYLADELGIDPMPETIDLHRRMLLADEAPAPVRLPAPLTSFVGRADELEAIGCLLREGARLVTLTGPGGAGKTRLALEAARQVGGGAAPDGVWFVDLTPVQAPDGLARAVAVALGLPPDRADVPNLIALIGARRMLLVLDNCEHLAEGAARLSRDLLTACPGLRLLATSRHALGLMGEAVWRLPELSPPDAARLFCDRAALAGARLRSDDPAIADLCERLDGLPLAIELAAARAHVLPPGEIAARLTDRFRLLRSADPGAPPRQQTLRGAVDWSHDLLSEAEQTAWRRLSVFAGSFSLAAAEAVCGEIGEAIDLLQALVDKSLLVPVGGRYRMLETIRAYGAERLEAAGEVAGTRDRHLWYCRSFIEEAEPHLTGPDQMAWFSRVEADLENVRAALRWAETGGGRRPGDAPLEAPLEAGLRIVGCLITWWYGLNYAREGLQWLDRLLAVAQMGASPPRPESLAKALTTGAFLAAVSGAPDRAINLAEEALALHRQVSPPGELARGEAICGLVAASRGDTAAARPHLARALEIEYAAGPGNAAALALLWSGIVARMEGDLTASAATLDEGIALCRKAGDLSTLAATLNWRGRIALALNQYDQAKAIFQEGLSLYWRLRNRQFAAASLSCLAFIALTGGDPHTAARLLGATDALLRSIALPLMDHLRAEYDQAEAGARAALGPSDYERTYKEGAAMEMWAAINLALGCTPEADR